MTVINVTDATLKGDVAGPTFTGKVDGSKFSGSVTYVDTTTPPVGPPPGSTHGLIENFNAASGSRFKVDGREVSAQNGNKSWSLKNPDDHTLTFEVHHGDVWSTSGWDDSANNRSEIEFSQRWSAGTTITVTELLTVLPGPVSTAGHLDLNQLHTTDPQSPPCPFTLQIEENTDRLQVILQSPSNGWNRVYHASQPVVRGKVMDFKFEMNMNPSGNGFVKVWLDGSQIVDYRGAVGANSPQQYYWKQGIYRKNSSETISAIFSNVHITSS
jgi:hypothetical protein